MRLTIGCGAYDRTWPLIASTITIDGIEFDWAILPPEQVFVRGMVGGEFQLSELSLGTYVVQLSRGRNLYRALPVFPSRAFRHSAIYVRADAGIERPEDLTGRNIGVPEWQLTAGVWARGILSDEYGVTAEQARWFAGDVDEAGRTEKVPFELPSRITLSRIAADQTLWALMEAGALDAIIAPRAPRAFLEGNPRVRRLFRDVKGVEQEYFARTGIFPIMHLLGIRHDLLAAHPELPARLFDGFDRARRHGLQELGQVAYFYVMLPWLVDHLAETRRVMGADYWPYGLEPNRRTLDTFCRYAHEQGMTEGRLTPDHLVEPL